MDEQLRVKARITEYESVEEVQTDLDANLETYNRNRPHRGRGMEGRIPPYQVCKTGIPKPYCDSVHATVAVLLAERRPWPEHESRILDNMLTLRRGEIPDT